METLYEYNYLNGLSAARALYYNTHLSEKAQRHRDVPHPEHPAKVIDALTTDEDDDTDFDRLEEYLQEALLKPSEVASYSVRDIEE